MGLFAQITKGFKEKGLGFIIVMDLGSEQILCDLKQVYLETCKNLSHFFHMFSNLVNIIFEVLM